MSSLNFTNNNFTKVVNTNVQATAILDGVADALSAISSTPGFTGYTSIKPVGNNIVIDDNTLQSISSSKVLLLDGTLLIGNIQLSLGGDTVDNAKRLIKIFGLDVNPNPKLITVAKFGTGPNTNNTIYLNNGSTTYTYVSIDIGNTGLNYFQILADALATKTGYFSVSLGNIQDSIVFNIVAPQVP